jgi:hypothetical protein
VRGERRWITIADVSKLIIILDSLGHNNAHVTEVPPPNGIITTLCLTANSTMASTSLWQAN